MVVFFSLVLCYLFFSVFFFSSFYSSLVGSLVKGLGVEFSVNLGFHRYGGSLVYILSMFMFIFLLNVFSLFPFVTGGFMYYGIVFMLSISFWVGFLLLGLVHNYKNFVSHLLPVGTPLALSFVISFFEVLSQLIRPFTLCIRLGTNLSAGHIMLMMFSYFSFSGSVVLVLSVYVLLFSLYVLELLVSFLQAYIFTSLLSLYLKETY
uniref:ATP synthase subunit a n=1 Tax=Seison sp. MS-2015 TaxID=1673261 RepID=A0A678N1Y3_9BILA|nr:ATP synthase F0 subunit 6 [Seison sp. MS-2015]